MIGKKTESEEMVSLQDAKEVLEARKKEGELRYEQQLAYDHAAKFAKAEKGAPEKLKKALKEFELSEKALVKVVEIGPKNMMTLKQMLMHENRTFSDEEFSKIMAAIKASA